MPAEASARFTEFRRRAPRYDLAPLWTRFVNQNLALPLAYGAYRMGWSPDHVTFLSSATWIAGAVLQFALLAGGSESLIGFLAVAVTFAVAYALDSADGQLARFTAAASTRGAWLDHTMDAFRIALVPGSALMGLAYAGGPGASGVAAVEIALGVLLTAQVLAFVGLQLSPRVGAGPKPRLRSLTVGRWIREFLLLPLDTGVTVWAVLAFSHRPAADIVYSLLALYAAAAAIWLFVREYRAIGGAAA